MTPIQKAIKAMSEADALLKQISGSTISTLAEAVEELEAMESEAVGVVNYFDYQAVAALVDPDTPLRMAVEETSPRSIQGLPKGTKLYATPQPPAAPDGKEREKAEKDLLLYGKAFMQRGKHIPLQEVTIFLSPEQQSAVPDSFAELVRFAYSEGQGRPINELSEFRWVDSESKRRLEAMFAATHQGAAQ